MCQERKGEEVLPKYRTELKPQTSNSKKTQKRAKTEYLWRPTIVDVAYGQTEKQQRLENKNGKKNIYKDTSNDKSKRLHMKKPGHG